ncbi:TRI25 ligase, partial [Polypterus senegalus]|nr:TRI25 ligase [Polypterus senegalus]
MKRFFTCCLSFYSPVTTANMFALEDDFTCSICLEVLNEPVSAPCGHSFCLACINKYWDQAEVCNCPQCREIFNPRPQLRKSTLLNELMEKLKMKQPHSRVAKHFDGSAMILCDFCSGEKLRAVKSCMTCLTSFCEIHIKHHNEIVAWKNHKLVNPTANIQEIFPLLTVPAEDDTLTNKITIADFSSEEVKRELSCVKEYLEELYQAELNNGISKGEALALMTMFEEPKSREDFLKCT